MTEHAPPVASAREALRYMVAVVAYRGAKALCGAPADFGAFSAGNGSRTALKILAHTNDLYDWAQCLAKGEWKWRDSVPGTWDAEVARFHAGLAAFDSHLASDAPLGYPAEKFMAGPIADSLNHIGQVNLLRRLAGSPVRGESYARADIVVGRLGPDQAAPRAEFD